MSDLEKLLAAIESVESQSGRNNYPRFEPAYAPKQERFTIQGRVVVGTGACWNQIVQQRWMDWGMASACSFGPWQILYHTAADLGFVGPPWDLWSETIAEYFTERRLFQIKNMGAATIVDYARAWNGGNIHANVPQDYIDKLTAAFVAYEGDPATILIP